MRHVQQNDIFYAIAHPARRAILILLHEGEKPASELVKPFGVTFSAISQHLKILKDAELVSERREGRQRIYHLCPEPLKEVQGWIEEFRVHLGTRLDALEAYLDNKYPKPE